MRKYTKITIYEIFLTLYMHTHMYDSGCWHKDYEVWSLFFITFEFSIIDYRALILKCIPTL